MARDVCEHDWPGSGCRECFPRNTAEVGVEVPIAWGVGAEAVSLTQRTGIRHHECRSWVHLFTPILDGAKTHDLRIDDRNYRVGDRILLREYDISVGRYTGRKVTVEITYITGRNEGQCPCAFSSAVLPRDYVILSIRKVN